MPVWQRSSSLTKAVEAGKMACPDRMLLVQELIILLQFDLAVYAVGPLL